MYKKIFFIIFFIIVSFIAGFSINLGYKIYDNNKSQLNVIENKEEINSNFLEEQEKPVDNIKVAKITPSTKMTYEYFYKNDEITEIVEDIPPYFLLDLTRNDLEENFKDWEVKSFSPKEVVLQKVIDGESTQHYIIGEYEGYLAVFYEKEINGTSLKDITDIPIQSLTEEEQQRIKNGIKITGKEELMKFLENYDS